MNVEGRIKTNDPLPLKQRSIIHLMLINNDINERINHALKEFGVSLQQFNVLRILRGRKGSPANLSTLNERMVTKMSNTTRLVDKLILKGFVNRIICPTNRRKVEISITSKGKKILKEMDVVMQNVEDDLVKNFSTKDLELLNQLLNKF
ncbi:MAG: MarR family transcriptional regulator [Maribacter sp.]|nr:MarR family transcriptional regulator [Maribacter sp.]MBT8314504.1 MarR family transcriptional regulator [Maribacter sp.]NNK19041.1 MarR family transcriptional regulator [Maribacter sp.]